MAEANKMVDCGICYKNLPHSDLFSCEGDPDHKFCMVCIRELLNQSDSQDKTLCLGCPSHKCSSKLESEPKIIMMFVDFLKERNNDLKSEEALTSHRLSRVEHELAKQQATCTCAGDPEAVKHGIIAVIDEMMILHCPNPNCRRPFKEIDGCSAALCGCGISFCAICLKNFGLIKDRNPDDLAHTHLKEVHGMEHDIMSQEQFKAAKKERLIDTVRDLAEKPIRELTILAKTASDISNGISVPVMMKNILRGLPGCDRLQEHHDTRELEVIQQENARNVANSLTRI